MYVQLVEVLKMRKIVWESVHYEFDPIKNTLSHPKDEPNDGNDNILDSEQMQIENLSVTPFGLWRLDDTFHPMKQFKFWMAHTNFSIGETSRNIIKNIPGVEVLRIISRYRFIIAIGNLFETTEVTLSIQEALCGLEIKDIQLSDNKFLSEIVQTLKDTFKEWCIYVFPNGKYEYAGADNLNDIQFNERRKLLAAARDASNGIFLTSKTKCNLIGKEHG